MFAWCYWLSFLPGSAIKTPLAMQKTIWNAETGFQFLGHENPLEKKMATHSSLPAWKIPWTEELGWLQSMGLQRVRHNWAHIQNKGKVISCSFLSLTRLNIDLIFMYAKICKITHQFSSVQFSRSVVHSHVCVLSCSDMSDFLQPHGL